MSTKIGGISPLQIQAKSRFYIGDPINPTEVASGEGLEASSFFSPASPLQLPSQRRLILPGEMSEPRFSFPPIEPEPEVIKIPIDEIIQGLEELGKENTRMSFGFHPMPIHDEFEVKWGERALSIARRLQDDLSNQTVEEAVKFLGSSKLISVLRAVLKMEDKTPFGINPTPVKKNTNLIDKANVLSERLLNDLTESTLGETIQFLESPAVSGTLKKLVQRASDFPDVPESIESDGIF